MFFIIYRRWGFVFVLLAALIGFLLLLLTHSLSLPLLAIAALWIYYGRDSIDPETEELIPSNSVYFVPLWIWGSIVLVPAVLLTLFEVSVGRPLAIAAAREREAKGEAQAAVPAAQNDVPGFPAQPRLIDDPRSQIQPAPSQVTPVAQPAQAVAVAPMPPAKPKTLQESRRDFEKGQDLAKNGGAEIQKIAPELRITDVKTLRPGQRIWKYWGSHWQPVRVLSVADPSTLVIHWSGYSTAWDERVPLDQFRSAKPDPNEWPPPSADEDERGLIDVRKPDRGADFYVGSRFLCDTDRIWLPVEIKRAASPTTVEVHWCSFDKQWDETVATSRLRLPIEKPPFGARNEEPPGDAVTFITDLDAGEILMRQGFDWKPVRHVENLGIDHVLVTEDRRSTSRKVDRSSLRIVTK
jgi:hypothetical protein